MKKTEILRNGIFYLSSNQASEDVFEITEITGENFSACYRNSSCWMKTHFTDSIGCIPMETQFLIAKKALGFTLFFMLSDGNQRSSLFSKDGKLYCRAETGDSNVPLGDYRYMYSIDCLNVYDGIRIAYEELAQHYSSFKLKGEKNEPKFINGLGYCTYNAFYSEVTHDNILTVEKAFAQNDVAINFIIADEGWMTARDGKISAFTADERKFPLGLAHTINECKRDYGLKQFFCWHTYNGYWKGVDGEALDKYGIEERPFRFPERFVTENKDGVFCATAGSDFYPMNIADQNSGICRDLAGFYEDFYAALKAQGVDGTKIDAITWQEAFSDGYGGRAKAMSRLMTAIGNASQKHFGGELINCSSCSNDFFMNIGSGSVVRTSCDYLPDDPDSHFEHIMDNAFVGMWINPIAVADWDMFESGSEWGSYHAAARAISGGPIYCTDKPEKANFSLIKRLCAENGKVNRCLENAKPTEQCLFGAGEGLPFRVFNKTENGYVLATFGNANCNGEVQIPVSEIYGLPVGEYAVYSSVKGFVGEVDEKGFVKTSVKKNESEIFTLVKITDGVAVIGDVSKLNPSAYMDGNVWIYSKEKGFYLDEGGNL